LFSSCVALLAGAQKQHDLSQARWYMHLAAWIVGMGSTICLLALVPARIISSVVQTGVVRGVIWVSSLALLFGLFCLLRKWLRLSWVQSLALWTVGCLPFVVGFHFSALLEFLIHVVATLPPMITILVMFSLVLLYGILLLILFLFTQISTHTGRRKLLICMVFLFFGFLTDLAVSTLAIDMPDSIVRQTWIGPAVWNEARILNITPHEMQIKMHAQDSDWLWALMQWHTHFGPLIAPFVAVGILLVWQTIRRSRALPGGFREMLRPWKYIRQDSKLVAKSCLVSSMMFLLIYLCVYPSIASAMEVKYHSDYENLVDFTKIQNELTKLTAEVKSDESLMDQLRADVEESNRKTAEQKKMRK
ncbi:MAG: hypothetical protein P1V19_24505, partial [Gimesia sp.]|nr:hypothetical protein [Gimesia sp.]